MERELTCIICPLGCQLKAELIDGKVVSVSGNTCKRGEAYANTECVNPLRVITTTVKTTDGSIVPVKTDVAVPKELVFECMNVINSVHPCAEDCFVGGVVCKNILNTGANLVVTAPVNRKMSNE